MPATRADDAWIVPAPPVTARQARLALLAAFFCAAFFELLAPITGVLLNVLSSFLVFLWYCRDREATGRRRSLLRNLGIIVVPFIAVPWYLMRRRPWRLKIRAFLRFLGYVGLILLATVTGALLTALVAGLLGLNVDLPS